MIALAPHTSLIFEKTIQLECIKPFLLVGGTALSLQLGTRQSEDLGYSPVTKPVDFAGNLRLADIPSIYA